MRQKLELLRRRDRKRQIFGAATHQYRLNRRLTEHQLRAFEHRHAVTLPLDYRTFLRDVGNGGAGPYYGLFPLEHYAYEVRDLPTNFLAQPFPHSTVWQPDEGVIDAAAPSLQYAYFGNYWVQGSLRICHYGCGVFLLLIVTGAAQGLLWADDRNSDQGIYPWGENLTFSAWYEQWLDMSLHEVSSK